MQLKKDLNLIEPFMQRQDLSFKSSQNIKQLGLKLKSLSKDTLCSTPSIPIIHNFSLEEFNNSIKKYIFFGVDINRILRGNQSNYLNELYGKTVENLDNIFARTPAIKEKISLHRVIKVNEEYNPNLNVGDVITDKGYMSCSKTYNADILKKNGLPLVEGTPIYITINIPEGKKVLDIKKYVETLGKKYKYDEVVLERGASIRIIAKNDNYIQAELL